MLHIMSGLHEHPAFSVFFFYCQSQRYRRLLADWCFSNNRRSIKVSSKSRR